MRTIEQIIIESIETKQKIIADKNLLSSINKSVESIVLALKNGNKIFFAGNGGSAADAQHLTAEFTGRFYKERTPLAAICLNTNVSSLTAIGNDYGYSEVFSRQITALGKKGDVLVGITTSGNSENIIKAFKFAKENGIFTIALTGQTGGDLKDYADILLNVPSSDTPRIQESHITIGHIICELAEKELFE
jgi:D-sedoheptulose 7-phosphate isomerase